MVYICLITDATFKDDPIIVKGGPGESGFDDQDRWIIPKEDYEYWQNECKPYPDPEDPAYYPPFVLPELCTFKLILEDGKWHREGYCCQCGICCKQVRMHFMMDPAKNVCKYLAEEI